MKSMFSIERLKRSFYGAVLAAGLAGLAVLLFSAYHKLNYPYLLGLGEPSLTQSIRFISEGKWPYRSLETPPYFLLPYGPVYPLFAVFLGKILPGMFLPGRVLCLAATIGAAGFIFTFLRKNGVRASLSAIAALGFLAHPYVRNWSVLVNVDMAGVCLELGALVFLWRFAQSGFLDKKFLALGIFFSVAAFFTKSSMLAVPAAFFIYAVFQKKTKEAVLFLMFSAGSALLLYQALNGLTHGAYFFHTTYEISQRLFFPQFIARFWEGAARVSPVGVLVTIFVLTGLARGDSRFFLALYGVMTLVLTVSLGKQGSDTNYLLEWCAFSSVAIGFFLERFYSKKIVGTIVLLGLFFQFALWAKPDLDFKKVSDDFATSRKFYDGISKLVRSMKGDVLSEDMSLLVVNGKEIFYEPFPMGQMAYSGLWNEELILQEIERQRFSLAILYSYAPRLRGNRTFTPAFMEKFKLRYRFLGRAEPPAGSRMITVPLFFYVPKREGEK